MDVAGLDFPEGLLEETLSLQDSYTTNAQPQNSNDNLWLQIQKQEEAYLQIPMANSVNNEQQSVGDFSRPISAPSSSDSEQSGYDFTDIDSFTEMMINQCFNQVDSDFTMTVNINNQQPTTQVQPQSSYPSMIEDGTFADLQNMVAAENVTSCDQNSVYHWQYNEVAPMLDDYPKFNANMPQIEYAPVKLEVSNSSGICPICGDKAGRHTYYGGKGCTSCRAFFRRTVQTKAYQKFKCKFNGQCEINSHSWKSCQACRFNKCLQAGMTPSWVMTEKERKARIILRAENKRKRLQQSYPIAPKSLAMARQPADIFTEAEYGHTIEFLQTTYDYLLQCMSKYYSLNHNVYDIMLSVMYQGQTYPLHDYNAMETYMLYCAKKYYSDMPEMLALSERDRARLVSKNYPLCLVFMSTLMVESPVEKQDLIRRFVGMLHKVAAESTNTYSNRVKDGSLESTLNKVVFYLS